MNDNMLFHLKLNKDEICAKYALLSGDPGRVEKIASYLDNARFVAQNREYTTYMGTLCGKNVIVCSTGIGGPSAAIAVEELHMLGVDTVIRTGTCGAMQLNIVGGDLVIETAAIRHEGTSFHYAPPEFPAVADFDVSTALVRAAKDLGASFHTGVVHCKDSFYGQHSPERMPVGGELLSKWNEFIALGSLASEMEGAAIFTVCASLGMRAGCVLHTIWNQERKKQGLNDPDSYDVDLAVRCAVNAMKMLIEG